MVYVTALPCKNFFIYHTVHSTFAFSDLMLPAGRQERHVAHKNFYLKTH